MRAFLNNTAEQSNGNIEAKELHIKKKKKTANLVSSFLQIAWDSATQH